MERVDLILKGDYVVTMDNEERVLKKGAVVVKDERIIAVGVEDEIDRLYRSEKVIGGEGYAVLPAFVNGHTHSPMVLFRGLADDLPLNTWLEDYIWPAENRFVGPEFIRDASELACLEMIRSGVCLFNDMYFYVSITAEVVKQAGIRAVLGTGILEFPTPEAKTVDECFEKAEDFIYAYKEDPLVVPAVAPHAPYTCSPKTYERAFELAEKHSLLVHTHLAETEWEVQEITNRYGRRPFEHMHHYGFLRPNLLVAHAVWPSEREIELAMKHSVKIAHCPESNLKLASGVAPVPDMIKKGLVVCLGTDGAASNNNLDIMEEMSTAAKVHKAMAKDPTVLDAKTVLKMATINGARALGLEERIGSLEVGKEADIVVIDLKRAHLCPVYNIYSHLVYTARASDIVSLVVKGRVLMEEGRVLSLDEDEILRKAKWWAERIIQQSN